MNVFKMMLACLMMFAFSAVNAEVPEKAEKARLIHMEKKFNSETSESQ